MPRFAKWLIVLGLCFLIYYVVWVPGNTDQVIQEVINRYPSLSTESRETLECIANGSWNNTSLDELLSGVPSETLYRIVQSCR